MNRTTLKALFYSLALLIVIVSVGSAVGVTEPGQKFGTDRAVVVWLLEHRVLVAVINILMMIGLVVLNRRAQIWPRSIMAVCSGLVALGIWCSNYATQTVFPSKQHNAEYYDVSYADTVLPDDQVMYVVQIGDDVRMFPREHLQIPHIAGWNVDGTDYTMTFCGLSNLPVVIEADYGLGESDLNVSIQTHNNLIFKDTKNDVFLQQITMESEFTDHKPKQVPNTLMSWAAARELYPNGQVFIYHYDRLLDKMINTAFQDALDVQFDKTREDEAAFPTLRLDDKRYNQKELIYGYDGGDFQFAFSIDDARTFADETFEVNGQTLSIKYNSEHDFAYLVDGNGEQLPTHNGLFWMVWSHWFPDTVTLNG
ncbi:hypothetical protein OAG1_33490 [Agarivorans sp. OAG1]|uniref:DUF3179 domain-containing (seleno)protein n=1 Tax=Agarivorans sp. OAG1 TaxID=3082387 RepID=UPI002B2C1542|nr:hypothetical protein OAG1_33490 [Agarivorans sp. OAG1]